MSFSTTTARVQVPSRPVFCAQSFQFFPFGIFRKNNLLNWERRFLRWGILLQVHSKLKSSEYFENFGWDFELVQKIKFWIMFKIELLFRTLKEHSCFHRFFTFLFYHTKGFGRKLTEPTREKKIENVFDYRQNIEKYRKISVQKFVFGVCLQSFAPLLCE